MKDPLAINVPVQSPYSIYIGENVYEKFITKSIEGKQVFIVTNETVADYYLSSLKKLLTDFQVDVLILPDGEQYKTLESVEKIFDELLLHRHTRQTTLLALGGGVIGDMTGFAAACYLRGVKYLQLPTTLLAQVDSAIGGKTGVNHQYGKNMIGAFYQPAAVLSNTHVLATLPPRVFKEGFAEIMKYGLIHDADFFGWLEQNLDRLLARDKDLLAQVIYRSSQIKAHFVTQDEKEQGIRMLLNLGHTFGHAIENAVGYGQWLHGEAVGVGLLLAADLSCRLGWFEPSKVDRIKNLLIRLDLPTKCPPGITDEQLLQSMSRDKKNISNQLRLILLKEIGNAVIANDVSLKLVRETLQNYLQ